MSTTIGRTNLRGRSLEAPSNACEVNTEICLNITDYKFASCLSMWPNTGQ